MAPYSVGRWRQHISSPVQFDPVMARAGRLTSRPCRLRGPVSATVWVEEADGTLVERPIRVGISDSQKSEVVGGRLEAGEAVVTRAREVRE